MTEWIERADGLLLGRKTYEIFAAHWPHVSGADPIASKFVRKHVVSRTLDRVEWNNSTLVNCDVVEAIKTLKRERGKELQVHQSAGRLEYGSFMLEQPTEAELERRQKIEVGG